MIKVSKVKSKAQQPNKMSPRTNKRQNRCLLCSDTSVKCNPCDSGFEIPGAANCSQLGSHLEKMFILRQLLDIPVSWCEQTLQRTSIETDKRNYDKLEHGDVNSGTDSIPYWFTVCSNCMKTEVRKAWEIYQQLLETQSKFNLIKIEIKSKMQKGLEKSKINDVPKTTPPESGSFHIQDDIQDLLFPAMKQEIGNADAELLFEDDDSSSSFYLTANTNCEESVVDNVVEYKPQIEAIRPRKDECRLPIKRKIKKNPSFMWHMCTLCTSKYQREEDLKTHLEMHERSKQNGGGKFDCSICKFPARNKAELYVHTRSRHHQEAQQLHECPKCDFSTRVWKVLKLHVSEYHDVETAEELDAGQRVLCSACPAVLKNKQSLSIHNKKCHSEPVGIHPEVMECDQCKMRFISQEDLDTHIYNAHVREARFTCDVCGKGFLFKSKLERHKSSHQEGKKYVCHICGCDYTQKCVLDGHIKKYHSGASTTSPTDPPPIEKKELKCTYCDFRTPYALVLRRHCKTHNQELGRKCKECGKCYATERGLSRHIQIDHRTVEKAVCPYCLKTFKSELYVRGHVRRSCKLKELNATSSSGSPKSKQ